MNARIVLATVVALAFGVATVGGAEDKKDPLAGVKCPVSGGKVKAESTVDYKDGKVYFCCNNCPKAFAKDTAKFAAKANQQLLATGQAAQVKCPLTGGKINTATATDIGGTKVCFCCKNCQGKAAKAAGDDQTKLVFGDEAFAKGFEVKKEEKK